MAKVISIANNKGGVAKTTTTLNLAVALTKLDKKVLMIDLDPQASLSVNFGINPLEKIVNINNVIVDDLSLDDTICPIRPGKLYISPSGIELSKAEFSIINKIGREYLLKNKIETLKEEFDYILIDNSPSLGILTINSLMASDYIIAPTDATYFAMKGLEILESTVNEIKNWNKNIEFLGVAVTMFDSRTAHHKEVLEVLKKRYHVFDGIVKRSIKFSDCCLNFSDIFEFAGDNYEGSIAYLNIAKEIISHD